MTRFLYPHATAHIDGDDFTLRDHETTLDAAGVPYGKARVVLPFLDDATLEFLDPRSGDVRVPITAGDDGSGESRTFDLGLREREIDHVEKTVTLRLATDEAILMDAAALVDDDTPFDLAGSLRDVVDYVLGAVLAASLDGSSADADVTPYWQLTNLHPNPTCTVGVGSYLAGGGCTIAWNGATGASGAGFCRATMTGATGAVYLTGTTTGGYTITPGRKYTLSVGARHSSAGANMALTMRWFNSDSQLIRTDAGSFQSVPTAWGTRFVATAEAPAGAARLVPFASLNGSAASQNWDLDAVLITEGDRAVPYFDPIIGAPGYTVDWEDAANASQSVRVPVAPRDPESLVWRAGQSAWDFLLPLCASVGLVLWCDENRVWRLQSPEARTISTLLSVSGATTTRGKDTLSREDTDTYVTGVVCRYRWTDRDGIARAFVDSAGTGEKVLVQEFDNTPYPGPGLAAAILSRRAGSGRIQDVTSLNSRWNATPGMTASITLPGAPDTLGRVSKVTFYGDGLMDLGMAGLIDVIPGSIAALEGTIDALTGTIADL